MASDDGGGTKKIWGKMSEADRLRKDELRREFRERLKAFSPDERMAGSTAIRHRLAEQTVWKAAKAILAYVPTAQEPDIWPAVVETLANGKQLALLRYSPDSDRYVPCLIRDPDRDLHSGHYGILNPSEIEPDAPLFGEGLGLDSIDVLEIALVVSKRYGFQLRSDNDDNLRIFSSLRNLAAYIARQRTK